MTLLLSGLKAIDSIASEGMRSVVVVRADRPVGLVGWVRRLLRRARGAFTRAS